LEEETLLRPFVGAIRSVRPDLMISFHADGISGHLDHRTVTARAAAAFDLAAEPRRWPDLGPAHAVARFWTYGIPQTKADRITYRKIHGVPDAEVDAVLDVGGFVSNKHAAVAAHATQKPFIEYMEQMLGDLHEYWCEEAFVLARSRVPLPESAARPVRSLRCGMDVG
jgi:LmbE family N-acetylglucosaminyl deacetylase